MKSGAMDDAIVQFSEVTQLPIEHYHLKAYHNLAQIYLLRGDKQQALAMEEKAQDVARKHGLDEIISQSDGWLRAVGLK